MIIGTLIMLAMVFFVIWLALKFTWFCLKFALYCVLAVPFWLLSMLFIPAVYGGGVLLLIAAVLALTRPHEA